MEHGTEGKTEQPVAGNARATYDDTEPPETGMDGEPEDVPGREPDYYAILGVQPDATADDIHRAFRRLAKLWHPDRFTAAPPVLHERAERRMRAIIRARDVLDDPIHRRAYDARRGEPRGAEPELGAGARPFPMPNAPPPFFGAGSMAHYERRTPNPNGAGQFFGILVLILAVGLAASAFNGHFGNGTGAFVVFALVLGLLLLAGFLFSNESALARAATHFIEAEPGPGRPRRAPGRAGAQRAKQHHHAGNHHQHLNRNVHDGRKKGTPSRSRHSAAAGDEPDEAAAVEDEQQQSGDHEFDALVRQALDGVPDEFQPWLENVVVQVVREPSKEQLRELQVRPNCTLLGLYVGVPLTHHYRFTGQGAPPEIITIFQGPIERHAGHDPERVKEQVRRTVLHEVAHHFGMSHEAMPEWIR